MKETVYMASYDTESVRCLEGLRPIFHPRAVRRFSTDGSEVRLLLEYVKERGIPARGFGEMYRKLSGGELPV